MVTIWYDCENHVSLCHPQMVPRGPILFRGGNAPYQARSKRVVLGAILLLRSRQLRGVCVFRRCSEGMLWYVCICVRAVYDACMQDTCSMVVSVV